MIFDVDAWARERREELFALFKKTGSFPSGAMVLAVRDPDLKELDRPRGFEQLKSDYASREEFMRAIRIHCERLGALAVIAYGEMTVTPHPLIGVDIPATRTFFMSLSRRGFVESTLWTARIDDAAPTPTLDVLEICVFEDTDRIFPVSN